MPSLVPAVLVLSCGKTDRIIDADDHYIHATPIGVSNKGKSTCMSLEGPSGSADIMQIPAEAARQSWGQCVACLPTTTSPYQSTDKI